MNEKEVLNKFSSNSVNKLRSNEREREREREREGGEREREGG